MARRPDLPFNRAWIKQGVNWHQYRTIYIATRGLDFLDSPHLVNWHQYRTIYIAPVNTDYLIQATWWQQSIRADQMQQDPEDGHLHAYAIRQGLPE